MKNLYFVVILMILTTLQLFTFDGDIKWIRSWLNSDLLAYKYSDNSEYIISSHSYYKRWGLRKDNRLYQLKNHPPYITYSSKIETIPGSDDIFLINTYNIYKYSFSGDSIVGILGYNDLVSYDYSSTKDTFIICYLTIQDDMQHGLFNISNGIIAYDFKRNISWNIKSNNYSKHWGDVNRNDSLVAICQSKNILAVYNDSGSISILDIKTGNLIKTIQEKTKNVNSISFSKDSNLLFASFPNGELKIWNTDTFDTLNSINFYPSNLIIKKHDELPAKFLLVYPKWMSSIYDKIFIFDPVSRAISDSIIIDNSKIKSYELSFKNNTILAINVNNELIETTLFNTDSIINYVSYINGAITQLATNWKDAYGCGNNSYIERFDPYTGITKKKINQNNSNTVFVNEISSDGNYLATWQANSIRAWDLKNDTALFNLNFGDIVRDIKISPISDILYVSGYMGAVKRFSLHDGKAINDFSFSDLVSTKMDFSNDGNIFACGICLYGNNDVGVWNFYNNDFFKINLTTSYACSGIYNLKLSPDNKYLYASLESGIGLWDIYSNKKVNSFNNEKLNVTSVVFTNDSKVLIVAATDGIIRFYRPLDSTPSQKIKFPGVVNTIKLSPTNNMLIASSNDGSLILYDVSNEIFLTGIDKDFKVVNNENFIFPNPSSSSISLNLPPYSQYSLIKIYSIEGIEVLETDYKDKIDVSGLAPGVYYVKVGDRVCRFIKI